MDRREFVRLGASAGAAAVVGLPGWARAAKGPPPDRLVSAAEMQDRLLRLDTVLARIDHRMTLRPAHHPVPTVVTAEVEDYERSRALMGSTVRALVVSNALHELPLHGQLHPGMQERVFGTMPVMDESLVGVSELLQSMTAADRIDLVKRMRDNPRSAMAVAEYLDGEASAAGMSASMRLQLRKSATTVAWRLQHQSVDVLAGEYVAKVDRVRTRSFGITDVQDRVRAMVGENEFWNLQQRVTSLAASWQDEGIAAPAGGALLPDRAGRPTLLARVDPALQQEPEEDDHPGGPGSEREPRPRPQRPVPVSSRGRLRSGLVVGGAVCLGVGVILAGVGIAFAYSSGTVGLICLIPGGLLLLAGAIMLANMYSY